MQLVTKPPLFVFFAGMGWGDVNVPVNLLTSCMLRELRGCLGYIYICYTMKSFIYIYVCVFKHVHTYTVIFTIIYIHMYVSSCLYLCTNIFLTYVHIYIT